MGVRRRWGWMFILTYDGSSPLWRKLLDGQPFCLWLNFPDRVRRTHTSVGITHPPGPRSVCYFHEVMSSESCGLRGATFEHQCLSNKELFGEGALPHCWSQNVRILLDVMNLLGSVERQRCKTVEPVGQTALVTQAVCPEGGGWGRETQRSLGHWFPDFINSSWESTLPWRPPSCTRWWGQEMGRGHKAMFHGDWVLVWEAENILEMDVRDDCTKMWMYLIQCLTWKFLHIVYHN